MPSSQHWRQLQQQQHWRRRLLPLLLLLLPTTTAFSLSGGGSSAWTSTTAAVTHPNYYYRYYNGCCRPIVAAAASSATHRGAQARRGGSHSSSSSRLSAGVDDGGDTDDDTKNTANANANTNVNLDKGFNLLETASAVVPQGTIVTAVSEGWKFVWKRMMAELAPQDNCGAYQRPSYNNYNWNYRYESDNNNSNKKSGSTSIIVVGDNPHEQLPLQTRTIATSSFPDEAGRYHVYTGNPCPWCHRVVLTMKLLDFSADQIGWTVLEDNPRRASRGGWILSPQQPDFILGGCRDLREIYQTLAPGYRGRCTAPLLIDTQTRRIVSNESAEICRLLNAATLSSGGGGGSSSSSTTTTLRLDLVPPGLQAEIDSTNEWVYRLLNNGVYRCGFATSQSAYDAASRDVLHGLTRCEERLRTHDYLCGSQFTESDVRLLPTILRFDGVYAPLFKAGGTHLHIQSNYPAIHQWLQRCWIPAVQESIDLADACSSYYKQLFPLNPGGIIPSAVTAKGLGLE